MPRGIYERTPEYRAAMSKAMKGIPKPPRTDKHCKAMSESLTGRTISPEHRLAISEGNKGRVVSEETRAAMSRARKGVSKSPETRAAMSKGREESGANDAMRGGNDIVNHHYIYDHADLSKNTVPMTRSDHTSLHQLLQKLGYVIPHINIKE